MKPAKQIGTKTVIRRWARARFAYSNQPRTRGKGTKPNLVPKFNPETKTIGAFKNEPSAVVAIFVVKLLGAYRDKKTGSVNQRPYRGTFTDEVNTYTTTTSGRLAPRVLAQVLSRAS